MPPPSIETMLGHAARAEIPSIWIANWPSALANPPSTAARNHPTTGERADLRRRPGEVVERHHGDAAAHARGGGEHHGSAVANSREGEGRPRRGGEGHLGAEGHGQARDPRALRLASIDLGARDAR